MITALVATLLLRQTATYLPAQTRVLVVAPVDASGDKQATTSAEELAEARSTVEDDFGGRGFVVVTGDNAIAAARSANVDLTAKANRSADNLYKMGVAANARLVVFTTVEKTSQRLKEKFMDNHLEGSATLKTWLLDVQTHKAILDGEEKGASSETEGKKEKNRQVRAVHIALEEQLHDFMKHYPNLKK